MSRGLKRQVLAIVTALLVDVAVVAANDVVSGIKFEPSAFDPAKGESVVIAFDSGEPGQAIVRLFGPDWHQVRELHAEHVDAARTETIAWNGRDDQGDLVPAEAYFPVVEFTDRRGRVSTFDPTIKTPVGPVILENLRFDRDQGVVTYTLEAPARVTVLAGIGDGGPLLRTLLADAPRLSGHRREPWSGMDTSGGVDIPARPGFRMFADGVGLWQPSVLVTGGSGEDYFRYRRRVESRLVKAPPPIENYGGTPAALPRPQDITPEPRFRLSVPGNVDEDGLPVVSGRVPVKVTLDESVRIPVIERRFEIVLFVDLRFVTEVEDGRSPATVIWDSAQSPDGRHLLTVNVATLPGQISAASLPVRVSNSP